MEKSDYEKISFGRVPFLWKKKINNLVKHSPEQAMTIFFQNFRENNEPKQMVYGFEQLLPHSLVFIMKNLNELNTERFIQLLDIFTNSVFLDSLLAIELTEQENFLAKIDQNWEMCDKSIIRSILGQFNPKLSEKSYKLLITTKRTSFVELLMLWVQCDIRVLYLVLQNYIQQPIDLILPLFRKISKEKLISACTSQNLPTKLSPNKIEVFLNLFDASREEVNYLIHQFCNSSNKAQEYFIEWLISKKMANSAILEALLPTHQTQTSSLIVSYFARITAREKEKEMLFLAEIIKYSLFTIASSVMNYINRYENSPAIDYLFSLLSLLKKDLDKYYEYFIPEFQKYSSNEEKRIIESYFNAKDENIRNILLPSIMSLQTLQWKYLIEQIIEQRFFTDRDSVSHLLECFDSKTMVKISKYIIKKKYITQLSYLYVNFSFFQPLIATSEPIETSIYSGLGKYFKAHFNTHFEEIVPYGKSISFPMSIIASIFEKDEMGKLISCIGLEKTLLSAWEEVFLLRPDEALPLFLKKFIEKSKQNKEPLVLITKKLIDIDAIVFWKKMAAISSKNLPEYSTLLKYAFDKSIPFLADLIKFIPTTHTSYIEKNLLTEFSGKNKQMLYAILSIQESSYLNLQGVDSFILAILKQNPKELIYLVLIRLSKLNTQAELHLFVHKLFNQIISKFPRVSLESIDDHNLSSFTHPVSDYINSLSEKKFRILLKYIIPSLKTKCLKPTIIDQCLSRLRLPSNDYKLIEAISTADQSITFSNEGQTLLSALLNQIVGRSLDDDLKILAIVQSSHLSVRESLFIAYFAKLPHNTLDYVLSDPSIDISDEMAIRALTTRFAKKPPSEPEKYYITLYQQSQRAEIKRAVLPLIGEYCSWVNLPFLMELPEREEFDQEYSISVQKFIERFEIDTSETLFRIWSSGLKDIYGGTLKSTLISGRKASYQSNCPKCNNPILEGQKNCGFCTQRLTCAICLKSVVTVVDVDLVECNQCSSFFHRSHLLQSVKIRNECPICGVRLTEREVSTLPQVQFLFH